MITGIELTERACRTATSSANAVGADARDNAASRTASSTVLAASTTWKFDSGRCAEVRARPEGHPLI